MCNLWGKKWIIIYCIFPILPHKRHLLPLWHWETGKRTLFGFYSLEFDSCGHVFIHNRIGEQTPSAQKTDLLLLLLCPPLPSPSLRRPSLLIGGRKWERSLLPRYHKKGLNKCKSIVFIMGMLESQGSEERRKTYRTREYKRFRQHQQRKYFFRGISASEKISHRPQEVRFGEGRKCGIGGERNIPHPRTFFCGRIVQQWFPFPPPPNLCCCLDKMNCG